MEFAFELIEHFLLIPPVFVDEHEREGGQGKFVSDVSVGFPVAWIGVNNASHGLPTGSCQVIFPYPVVARVCLVVQVVAHFLSCAVRFFLGDEVNAVVVFEFAPLVVVDTGFVPAIDDLPPFGGVVAQGFWVGFLDDAGVVFFHLSPVRFFEVDVIEMVVAQVEAEEVAGGSFLAVFFGVKTSCVQVVAVAGVDVKIVEFRTMGKGIRQGSFCGVFEPCIDGGEVAEPAFAFEGFEKMAGFIELGCFKAVVLDEFISCGRGGKAAEDPEFGVVQVRDGCAVVLLLRQRVDLLGRSEEGFV